VPRIDSLRATPPRDLENTVDEVTLTYDELEALRVDNEMEPDTIYIIEPSSPDADGFAVSPDGIGMYWYASQELLEADYMPANA
jgi:hypothetical protein